MKGRRPVTKRKTVFSLNLEGAVMTETASWEPRQQSSFCGTLTGCGLQWERRCIFIDQAFLNSSATSCVDEMFWIRWWFLNRHRFGHFIDLETNVHFTTVDSPCLCVLIQSLILTSTPLDLSLANSIPNPRIARHFNSIYT